MTVKEIKVRTKKELETQTKEYRTKGYMIITFTQTFIELEKGNELIVIEKQRRK